MNSRWIGATLLAAVLLASTGCARLGAEDREAAVATVEPAGPEHPARFGRIPPLVAGAAPSVVAIVVTRGDGAGEGSGVIWDESGVIVTNDHVVSGATSVEVAFASGDRVRGRVVATDPLTDLAVVRVDADTSLPAIGVATREPVVGELAVAIGNPLGFEHSATAGIVSGLHRSIPSGGRTPALIDLVQTDAPISPGNSGGALINARGNLIGINVAFIPPAANAVSIGFAVPAATVEDVVSELLEDGQVRHAFLGVELRPLTPEIAAEFGLEQHDGAVVADVVGGGPAARAGVATGDIIVGVGETEVENVEDVYEALRRRSPGDDVELEVLRERKRVVLEATLAERPHELRRDR